MTTGFGRVDSKRFDDMTLDDMTGCIVGASHRNFIILQLVINHVNRRRFIKAASHYRGWLNGLALYCQV